MEKEIRLVFKESGISITNRTLLQAHDMIQSLRNKYGDSVFFEEYQEYGSESSKYYIIEKRLETDEEFNHRIHIHELQQRNEYERLKKIYG